MVSILCYKSKTLANGEHPLVIRICKDGKKKYQSIGVSVKAEHWDFEKNQPKRNCPNKELIQNIIEQKSTEYRKQILEFQSVDKVFSASKLLESVNKPPKKKTVEELFLEIINGLIKENRIGNANSIRFALNSLKSFNGTMNILFSEIDVNWLKKYEAWMRSKGNSENTLGVRFRALRVVFNKAIEEQIVKKGYYPFDEFKVSRLKETTKKRAITKVDIQKLIHFDVKTITTYHSSLLQLSKDIFLFSYLGCGINFIDIVHLEKSNIEDNRVFYERHKTGKKINFWLHPLAIEILNKYDNPASKYLFPILNENIHKTELQKHYRVRKSSKKINLCLRHIGDAIGLKAPLTTYVARHSYATVLKRSGVSTSIISESLGHSSERITQIYLNSFDNEQVDEAMKNLL